MFENSFFDELSMIFSQFLYFFYSNNTPPKEIIVNEKPIDEKVLISLISKKIESKISLKVPSKGKKLSILKMGMTDEDVTQIMGPRFNYDGRCGNFGKYVLVFTNNTLIKACKIGEIYTQFGEYAVVNDCEDCDDMEVKNLLKY